MSFLKICLLAGKPNWKTPEERKAASIQRLKKEGTPYIEHLPVIEVRWSRCDRARWKKLRVELLPAS